MSEPIPRRSRWKRCVFICLILAVVIIGGLLAGLSVIPGGMSQLEFAYRPPVGAPAPLPPVTPATPGASVAEPAEPARKLYLTYVLPGEVLQREVSALFPVTEGVEGLLKLVLSNPQFVPDPDETFLRLKIDLVVVVPGDRAEQFGGQAVIRTQLRFDRGANTVSLSNADLSDFRFTGAAAAVAEGLRPVIQGEIAAQLNGYVVFKLSPEANWWARNGVSWVQDVVVENGSVVVVLGR